MWLARVGKERIEEAIDPEQAIDRAFETYLKKGYCAMLSFCLLALSSCANEPERSRLLQALREMRLSKNKRGTIKKSAF
jgi:hypothetical protein